MLSSLPIDANLITMVLSTETDHVLYESSEMPLRNQVRVHVHVSLLGIQCACAPMPSFQVPSFQVTCVI